MTVESFIRFAEAQPEHARWELIDGQPVMNPSPTFNHQKIVANLLFALETAKRQGRVAWDVLPGIGVKLSQTDMPVPDVLLRPRQRLSGHFCDDMIVAFEVLSPSTRSVDLRWKRSAYPKLDPLQHYIVLEQDEVAARCFDRANGWTERHLGAVEGELTLQSLGLSLSFAAFYADTGL